MLFLVVCAEVQSQIVQMLESCDDSNHRSSFCHNKVSAIYILRYKLGSMRVNTTETTNNTITHYGRTKHRKQDTSPNPYNPNPVISVHIEIFQMKERLVYMQLIRSNDEWIAKINSEDLSQPLCILLDQLLRL